MSWIDMASMLLGALTTPEKGVCQKCGAAAGTIFCSRSLMGEPGACQFKEKLEGTE